MNRRTFLQNSSLIIPGISVAGMLGATPGKLFADSSNLQSFSLSIVSDQPDKANVMIQELLNRVKLPHKNIHYTEYILHGNHIADIAYTRSGQLINFHHQDGPVSNTLRKISARLNLPRSCENPVLAHFSCEQGIQKPTGIQIFKGNELIMEKAFPEKKEVLDLNGLKGKVTLEIAGDRSVRFIDTSCKHKTCLNMGAISQAGQNLVCIPNQIAVTIKGTNISGVDSVTF